MEKREKTPSKQAIERAQRIRHLRKTVLKLSRKEFCQKHNIAEPTLRNWEELRYGGLTEKSVTDLVAAFQAEGIDCDTNWLLYGKGHDPLLRSWLDTSLKSDEALLAEELKLFYQLHRNVVDTIINDDGLTPCYQLGYRVAGERFFNQDISKATGLPSIVQTQAGKIFTRLVKPGTISEHYTLVCTNPHTAVSEPIMENIKLFSAAPIIWCRRPRID
jgi:hypothetical protein